MEGVGARLGRSSARYAPTTVFSGPVRRWKKKWVPLSNPNNSNSNNNHSHLLLYKWAPITPFSDGSAAATPPSSGKDAIVSAMATPPSAAEEPVRRKFRYIPVRVSVLEQKMEINVKSDDDSKPDNVDTSLQPVQVNGSDRKADESDALMDEAQNSEKGRVQTEEARETNLDLSLGLKAHDEDQEDDPKFSMASSSDGTGMKPSESETRKRKSSTANLEMRV